MVWVTGKGDSCDPFTENDAGKIPASKLLAISTRNYLRVVTEFAKHFGKSPDKRSPISGTLDRDHASIYSWMASECLRKPAKEQTYAHLKRMRNVTLEKE